MHKLHKHNLYRTQSHFSPRDSKKFSNLALTASSSDRVSGQTAEALCSLFHHAGRPQAQCCRYMKGISESLRALPFVTKHLQQSLLDKQQYPGRVSNYHQGELIDSCGGGQGMNYLLFIIIKTKMNLYLKMLSFQEQQSRLPTQITGLTLEKMEIQARKAK